MYLKIYVCAYACICATTIKKEATNLKEYGGYMEEFGERKGMAWLMLLYLVK